jgi:hypothetical protein
VAQLTIAETKTVEARYLKVEAGVRYWEDASVNDTEDEDGSLIPFRSGDYWCPTIDLDAGVVEDWPADTTASIHYKVCDDGRYVLLDEGREEIVALNGYVPSILSPGGNGYGDYVIMQIDENGHIGGWRIELDAFEDALS